MPSLHPIAAILPLILLAQALVVISDGGDNAGKHKLADITAMAERSNAVIYVSTNRKQDGTHRTIRLVADAPGASGKFRVRTRTGYVAQGVP